MPDTPNKFPDRKIPDYHHNALPTEEQRYQAEAIVDSILLDVQLLSQSDRLKYLASKVVMLTDLVAHERALRQNCLADRERLIRQTKEHAG